MPKEKINIEVDPTEFMNMFFDLYNKEKEKRESEETEDESEE
jgi:hypothetical protein